MARDFERRNAVLRDLRIEPAGQQEITVSFRRGDSVRRLSLPHPVADVESAVVALAERLQEKELEEAGAGHTSWPGCRPGHPHPPEPVVAGGRAAWACPRTAELLALIE